VEVMADIRSTERTITQRQWVLLASRDGASGVRLRDTLLPHLPAWVNRRWGGLTFRVTQLLTGHGSFGTYLRKIGKVKSAICLFCGREDDTAAHTLQSCPEWLDERSLLIGAIGPDPELATVIGAISANKDSWVAFASFAETVMRKKEDAERMWEVARVSLDFDPG